MDFYKLSNFQLYSIIHSRHLDKENKEAAIHEFDKRNLSEEEEQQLADEFDERLTKVKPATALSSNIILLIVALIALFLLRQCVYR